MANATAANESKGSEQAKGSPGRMQASKVIQLAGLYARIFLGAAFLSAVADR